jgi:large subunit ribosomal protein L23
MNPFQIIKGRRITEKGRVLENLQHASSNASLKRCKSPKVVFNVHPSANKREIAMAVEHIYADNKVKVVSVNTINVGSKKRRVKGFMGKTANYKKAVVTLRPGDSIESQV